MALAVPPELLKAAAERKLVLFAGAGMSQPQLPGWQTLLESIAERGRRANVLSAADADSLRDLITQNMLVAAGALRTVLGDEVFYELFRAVFREADARPTSAHTLLPEIRFSSVLTTNFDKLIEQAFPPFTPAYTQFDHAELAAANREQSFCIVKVHGDLERTESIVLGQADYRRMMFANEPFRIFLTTIFTTRTVVFVGCSMTDPDLLAFLEQLKFQMEGHLGGHFAFMRTEGMNRWLRKNFEESYGIQVIGDDERAGYPDIPTFLAELKAVAPAPRRDIIRPSQPRQAPPLPAHLVHRRQEEEQVKALLLREDDVTDGSLRIVAIHGMAGVGKSTLAAAIANDGVIAARFAGGVLWAELKPEQTDLVAVLNGWLRELEDRFESSSVDALSGRLRSCLRERAVLLVLDSVWNAETARALLAGGARSRALITTRRADVADELGAELYELGPLSAEESLELLSKRLGSSYVEGQFSEALDIAEATGHHPLALELVAVRVKRGMAWSELKRSLQYEIARLESLEAPRRTTGSMRLQAAFNLSLSALRKDHERAWRSFCWLGIVPGDAVLAAPAAATLFDVKESEAESLLEVLWNDALLSRGPRMPVGGTSRLTYRIHNLLHAVARDLLCDEAPAGLGYRLAEAHGQLVERLYAKAGVNPGQPMALALPDDGYSHAHLVWHLEQAGNIDGIHALLREQSPQGRNAWLEARRRLRDMPGFLADLARAWRLAEAQAARELLEGKAAHSTALEVRYALMTASLNSSLRNVPPKLALRLVEAGIWTATEALAVARQAGESTFAEVIGPLGAFLPESELRKLSRIEWGSEGAIPQAITVAALAEHLPKELLAQRLEEVLDHADSLRDWAAKMDSIAFLGPLLGGFYELLPEWIAVSLASRIPSQGEGTRQEALSRALSHARPLLRSFLLAGLVPGLEEPARTEALQEVLEFLSLHRDEIAQEGLEMQRALYESPFFVALVRQQLDMEAAIVPGFLADDAKRLSIDQIVQKVRAELEEEHRLATYVDAFVVSMLTGILEHVPDSLLPTALQIAWSLQDESTRFDMVAHVLARMPEPGRALETGKAFEVACALEDAEEGNFRAPRRFRALTALAPCLGEAHWRWMLADLRGTHISSREDLLEILVALVPHAPQEMLADLESLDQPVTDESYGFSYGYSGSFGWMFDQPADAKALGLWLARLPRAGEAARHELAGRALRLVETFPVNVGDTLERLGPWLTEPELRGVLRLIRGWNDPGRRTEALTAIARHLPASLLPEALEITAAVLDRGAASEALHGLAVTLVEDGDGLAGLAAAEALPDPFLQTEVLVRIAPMVGGPERRRIGELALEASERVPEGEYRYRGDGTMECRSAAIAMSALLLDEPARSERLRKALETEEKEDRPAAQARLSRILAEAGHAGRGLDHALRISESDARCSALVWIAESLNETDRARVLTEVSAHPEPEMRARLLAWLAAFLSPVQAERTLEIASDLEEPFHRVLVWTALLPRLPEQMRPVIVGRAMDLATQETDRALRVRMVAALLPSLVERDREDKTAECLRECRDMADDAQRAQAFVELLSQLGGELLLAARDVARSGKEEQWQNQMRSAVAAQLAKVGRVEDALDEITGLSQEGWKAETLRQIAGSLTSSQHLERALEIAAKAPEGYLTRTDTLLIRGGKHTAQTAWSAQAAAVARMASRLPDSLKAALHDLLRQILHRLAGRERRELLLGIGDLNAVIRRLADHRASAAVSHAVSDSIRWWPP